MTYEEEYEKEHLKHMEKNIEGMINTKEEGIRSKYDDLHNAMTFVFGLFQENEILKMENEELKKQIEELKQCK